MDWITTWANSISHIFRISPYDSSNGPYGYSSSASRFDDAIGKWAQVQYAKDLVKDALSCGYTGLVMLHGALYGCAKQNNDKHDIKKKIRSKVLANRNATYYGMMVAIFSPNHDMMYFNKDSGTDQAQMNIE